MKIPKRWLLSRSISTVRSRVARSLIRYRDNDATLGGCYPPAFQQLLNSGRGNFASPSGAKPRDFLEICSSLVYAA